MRHLFWKIRHSIKRFIKLYVIRDELFIARTNFKLDNKEQKLRTTYPLTPDSVVFDVGAYTGEWADEIIALYNPYLYAFEPVPAFYEQLRKKYKDNPKVRVFPYGLDGENTELEITIDDISSSVYRGNGEKVRVPVRRADEVITELGVTEISLFKINNEGGEYGALRRMLSADQVKMCEFFHIQFHVFFPNSRSLREQIKAGLRQTHECVYDYPFFFENWKRK